MSLLKKNEKELLTVLGDPFRNKTKTNILISAEYLFGNKGINETSTRDINIHANLRNSSSLSYHFGNKENLIDSILTARISELEEIRMRNYNAMLKDKKNLSKKDLVLDIGANDGTLLKYYKKKSLTLGCEPAKNLYRELKNNWE